MIEDRTPSDCATRPCELVAFVAHPDDAELNCGGTLALAAARGQRVAVVDLTRGELGTRGTPERRAEEAALAARALGLSARINLGLPDGHLHDTDEARRAVVDILRRLRPTVVIAPPLEDHHPDHAAAGRILANSVYLAGVARYAPGLEPWRPHALLHYLGSRAGVPRLVVDVTPAHEARRAAILCYRSQFHDPDSKEPATRISHPQFLEAIEGTSRRYGALIGVPFGEAFTSAEPVPTTDLVGLYERVPWKHPDSRSSASQPAPKGPPR